MANLPGGKILAAFGGYMGVRLIGGTDVRIDVGKWELSCLHALQECPHSGSLGAITRRRVFEDWQARVNIWYMADSPVEQYLRTGWGFALGLYISSLEAWLGYGFPGQKYYYAPSGLLEEARTINSTQDKDVVRQELLIKGNSLMFLLPDEQAAYNAYLQELQALGQV